MKLEITIDGKTTRKSFSKRDQFGPELVYFSDCILHDRLPEPSGLEGLTDVQVICALYKSARTGRAIELCPPPKRRRPDWKQEITKRATEAAGIGAYGTAEPVRVIHPYENSFQFLNCNYNSLFCLQERQTI